LSSQVIEGLTINYENYSKLTAELKKEKGITLEGHLAQIFHENSSLKALHLDQIPISGSWIDLFGSLLQSQSFLSLYLTNTSIRYENIRKLSNLLQQNQTLQELTISAPNSYESLLKEGKVLGENGACMLARCLVDNKSIIELNFLNNAIGILGRQALVKALYSNTTLIKINTQSNGRYQSYDEESRISELDYEILLRVKFNEISFYSFVPSMDVINSIIMYLTE